MDRGVTRHGYNPPIVKPTPTDVYHAPFFEIKIRSYSSLPSVASELKKMANGRPATKAGLLVRAGIQIWSDASLPDETPVAAKLAWLDAKIGELKQQLYAITSRIQRAKFGILLTKRWFSDLTTRENPSIIVDGKTCTISVTNKEIKI